MPIDWSWQDTMMRKDAEREADEANRRNKALTSELDSARGNSQADTFTINALERKLAALHERLGEVEGELRHYKSRDAGFLAEVRALIEEIRNCPHQEHHKLLNMGENDQTILEDKFDEAYDARWE